MGAPPKCRLLPSVRAARASSDPVAHSAPRPRPRPAACAWCEEPPERGLPHCDDRTTWPRSVVPLASLSRTHQQPADGAVCAQARLHAQCARRLCQCTRNARAVHAHITRSADALSTRPHTSGVTRRPCAWHTTHPAPPHTAHARPRRVARPAPQEPGRRAARSRDEAPVKRAAGSHLSAAEAQVAAAGAALQAQTPRQQAEAAKKTFSLLTYSASEVQPGEPEASPSHSPSPVAEGCSPCPS